MRSDVVVIGGKEYPIKGPKVSEALDADLDAFEARQAKNTKALREIRLRRFALGLQNGGAFLPDPKNPKGEMSAASMPTEEVMAWVDSDVFADMDEFYKAEAKNRALADPVPAAKAPKGATDAPGESPATE